MWARVWAVVVLLWALAGCVSPRQVPAVQPDPRVALCRAADFVLRDFPQPPPFDWGEGVLMAGMVRAGEVSGDQRYLEFVGRWADHWCGRTIGPLLSERGYCGHWGPGFALLMLYERDRDQRWLDLAGDIVAFMEKEATRTADGGLGHWRDNRQLWVDTLYMSCPVYAKYGRLTGRAGLVGEAARQLAVSRSHLQDDATGLFYHMYDAPAGKRVGQLWGRGNGWTAMAYVETLGNLDRGEPAYEELAGDFRRLAGGLIAAQDLETGLWHTVLDRADSYLETSASAMILYSLVEGHRLGLIDLGDMQVVVRGWRGLADQLDAEGRVIGVSAGTGPADYEGYAGIPRGSYTWGTGAFLLAAGILAER